MNFNIVLFEGTDSIKFGMTHEEIKTILGKEPLLFKKDEFDLYMTEDYNDICHVYYDSLHSMAFEFFEPSQVFYGIIQLLGQKRKDIEDLFSGLEDYEKKSDSLNAFGGDFSVWGQDERIESVYISRKGYSEEQRAFYEKAYADKYKTQLSGHYCKVCGENISEEEFTAEGITANICKICESKPTAQLAQEMMMKRPAMLNRLRDDNRRRS